MYAGNRYGQQPDQAAFVTTIGTPTMPAFALKHLAHDFSRSAEAKRRWPAACLLAFAALSTCLSASSSAADQASPAATQPVNATKVITLGTQGGPVPGTRRAQPA